MDNAEGHACCPLGLRVELPPEMIRQPVLHLSTCVPHKARFLNLTAEQGHVRPRTQFSESPTDAPGSPQVVWSEGPAGQLRLGSSLTGPFVLDSGFPDLTRSWADIPLH